MALHAMDVLPRVGILCALRHRLTYPSSQFTHETAMHVISPCQIAVNGSLRSFGYLDPGKFVTAKSGSMMSVMPASFAVRARRIEPDVLDK